MNPLRAAISAMAVFMVSGCFLKMEGVGPLLKYNVPLGAHYVKPEMTREERLQDLAACGNAPSCGLRTGCFAKADEEIASKAKSEFIPGKNNDGYFILLRRLDSCMAFKGYHKLPPGTCDGNDPKVMEPCMYP
jgi:hypothetical protein